MDASMFAPESAQFKAKNFRFGLVDGEAIAENLRDLAEVIEEGIVVVQSVKSGSEAKADDFFIQSLTIDFTVCETEDDDEAEEDLPLEDDEAVDPADAVFDETDV